MVLWVENGGDLENLIDLSSVHYFENLLNSLTSKSPKTIVFDKMV